VRSGARHVGRMNGWCDRRRQNRKEHNTLKKKENSTRESIMNETSTLNPELVG